MIAKYFIILELLGYVSLFFLLVNAFLLMHFYIKLFSSNKRCVSWIWLFLNVVVLVAQIIFSTLFIYDLIDPYNFSKQGKIDMKTAENFIFFAAASFIMSIIGLVITNIFEPLFGAYFKGRSLYISNLKYSKQMFYVSKRTIKFGKHKKWKMIPKISIVYKWIAKQLSD